MRHPLASKAAVYRNWSPHLARSYIGPRSPCARHACSLCVVGWRGELGRWRSFCSLVCSRPPTPHPLLSTMSAVRCCQVTSAPAESGTGPADGPVDAVMEVSEGSSASEVKPFNLGDLMTTGRPRLFGFASGVLRLLTSTVSRELVWSLVAASGSSGAAPMALPSSSEQVVTAQVAKLLQVIPGLAAGEVVDRGKGEGGGPTHVALSGVETLHSHL